MPALEKLITLLDDSDELVRTQSARALAGLGEPIVPEMIRELESAPASHVRAFAARILGDIGPRAAKAVVPLIHAASSDVQQVQELAVWALGRIGPAAQPATSRLMDLLSASTDKQMRALAARSLGDIGEGALSAVPRLLAALEAEDKQLRRDATRALGEIGPAAESAVPRLITVLEEDADLRVRQHAAWSLGQIRVESAEVRAALKAATQHPFAALKQEATAALELLDYYKM